MLQPVRRESSPIYIALVAAIAKIPLESVAATDATASPHTAQGTDPNAESPQGYRRRRVHLSRHRRGFRRCILLRAALPAGLCGDRSRMARSEEHTSDLQSLMRISYAVLCFKQK